MSNDLLREMPMWVFAALISTLRSLFGLIGLTTGWCGRLHLHSEYFSTFWPSWYVDPLQVLVDGDRFFHLNAGLSSAISPKNLFELTLINAIDGTFDDIIRP